MFSAVQNCCSINFRKQLWASEIVFKYFSSWKSLRLKKFSLKRFFETLFFFSRFSFGPFSKDFLKTLDFGSDRSFGNLRTSLSWKHHFSRSQTLFGPSTFQMCFGIVASRMPRSDLIWRVSCKTKKCLFRWSTICGLKRKVFCWLKSVRFRSVATRKPLLKIVLT